MDARRFLITGGLGYIGTALIASIQQKLPQAGVCVLDIDIHRRALQFSAHRGCLIHHESVLNPEAIGRLLRDFRPHHVYHLAAQHYLPDCINKPHYTLQLNVQGTKNIVDAVNQFGKPFIKTFVFASSAAVYKDLGSVNSIETDPVGGMDAYGQSKTLAEAHVARLSSAPYAIARIFNVYGRKDPIQHLIPSLCKQVAEGNETIRVGDLRTTRDYVHVDDVARALFMLSEPSPSRAQNVYNIGSGEGVSGAVLVSMLKEASGRHLTCIEDPIRLRPTDRRYLVACNTAIKADLTWFPTTNFRDGLKAVLHGVSAALPVT